MWNMYKVEDAYRRFPEISRDEVLKFQEWIHSQPHMPKMSEHDALLFYYASKCSTEVSKQVLDTYLTCRTHVDGFFRNLDVDRADLQNAMKLISICPMPKLTPDGYGVVIAKLIDTDTSTFNFAAAIKLVLLTMDIWIQTIGVVRGLIFAIDLQGVKLGHVARIGILDMKKFLYYLQEAIPIRMHGFHFVNPVPFMDKILALMTPFMKKELQNVLRMHSCLNEFYKYVPQEMLPKEIGGDLPHSKELREVFYGTLRSSRNEILEFERTHLIDEAKRPGKAKSASDLFGVQGSFKKLDID
ncbi:alpha-tocopherol transfer protein-like [Haematobia irritans]|uniref:alpha-tocopherol transfer protein-like n=1 Tax=Haematobia irritans TaxID=7368 RepID=UPI003F501806